MTADRAALRADCARCFGLCCVALPFTEANPLLLRASELAPGALFLTQHQLDAARGDTATRLSAPLRTPAHWRTGD